MSDLGVHRSSIYEWKKKKKKLQEKRENQAQRDELKREDALFRSGKLNGTNQSKHAPNNTRFPPQYYVDLKFTCVDCGKVETWTAKQQQWWYEVAKGPIYSTANRCHDCSKKKRQQNQQQDEPTEEST